MTKKNLSAVIARSDLMNVITYNQTTGEFAWREREHRQAYFANRNPGTVASNGRLYISINGVRYLAHRLAWFYVTAAWPNGNVVPKNGDYLDLRFANLVVESQSQTSRKAKRVSPSSGERGVFWDSDKAKWRAEITVNYKNHIIGRYLTKQEAVRAYRKACRKLHLFDGYDENTATAKRESSRAISNMRRLWRRTLKASGGVTGWGSFEEFQADILRSSSFQDHRSILPLDPNKKVGPDNWHWGHGSELGQYDFKSKEGRNTYNREHRLGFLGRYRSAGLLKSFGITLDQYNEMLKAQAYGCAICARPERTTHRGRPRALAVDHCHKTGIVRGLLCNDCNTGIARFDDDVALMRRAIAYVEKHAQPSTSVPASHVTTLKPKERSPL